MFRFDVHNLIALSAIMYPELNSLQQTSILDATKAEKYKKL